VIASASACETRGLRPLARIVAYSSHAQAPEWFTTAPGPAIRKALDRAGWNAADVDLYEINEAFACVTMAAIHDLGIDAARQREWRCVRWVPIGATGAGSSPRWCTRCAGAVSRGIASRASAAAKTAIAIELVA
jgi:acetyl-CoA C-acetyltransferase